MAVHVENEPQGGEVSTLVSGIIQDARQLLVQQLTLFQVELKRDFRQAVEACIPLVIGMVLLLMSLVTLLPGAAYLLCWIWPDLPLWAGFFIIGGSMAAIGVVLVLVAWLQFDSLTPPAEKSVEGLKENFQWKTKT